MSKSGIEFIASVYKVQTLVDGGLRLTLDLSESAIPQAQALMECHRTQSILIVSMKQVDKKQYGKKLEERRESIG